MFSRAVLPSLRSRSLLSLGSARAVFHVSQARTFAKQRDDSASKRTNASQNLRSVKPSYNERIRVDRNERSSNVTNPVAAPGSVSASEAYKLGEGNEGTDIKSSASVVEEESSENTKPSSADEAPGNSQPLPDLTKGIPSTLEAELSRAQAQYSTEDKTNITEDPERPPPGPGGRGGGDLPKSAYVSSSDRRRSAAAKYIYLGLTLGATGYLLYLGRDWDTEEEAKQYLEAPNGYTPGAMYKRVQARLGTTVSYYSDPVTTKLLPDEGDPSQRAPFVLVLSLEDMLVHSDWTRQTGYRIAKRPGVDYFLRYLSQYYELVLFTSQPSFVADQILRKLDPYTIIQWPLFREHTLYKDGGYVKDISYLNRDLKKVVMLDTEPHHVMNQPENAIVIPKWTGDPQDQTLIQLIPFLEYLATMGFDDARTVLKSFEGKFIPAEFARREKLLREKFEKDQAAKRPNRGGKGLGIGSLFGAKQPSSGLISASESSEGKMVWDQIREQGQKNYESIEKRIQEEGASWLAAREAEEKRLQEEFSQNMKSGMFGWFGAKKE